MAAELTSPTLDRLDVERLSFASLELLDSQGDLPAKLGVPLLLQAITLLEKEEGITDDVARRTVKAACHLGPDELLLFFGEPYNHISILERRSFAVNSMPAIPYRFGAASSQALPNSGGQLTDSLRTFQIAVVLDFISIGRAWPLLGTTPKHVQSNGLEDEKSEILLHAKEKEARFESDRSEMVSEDHRFSLSFRNTLFFSQVPHNRLIKFCLSIANTSQESEAWTVP